MVLLVTYFQTVKAPIWVEATEVTCLTPSQGASVSDGTASCLISIMWTRKPCLTGLSAPVKTTVVTLTSGLEDSGATRQIPMHAGSFVTYPCAPIQKVGLVK